MRKEGQDPREGGAENDKRREKSLGPVKNMSGRRREKKGLKSYEGKKCRREG